MNWHTHKKKTIPLALAGIFFTWQVQAAEPQAGGKDGSTLQRLAKSDARAAALQKRIEELEKRVNDLTAALAATAPAAPAATSAAAPAAAVQAGPARNAAPAAPAQAASQPSQQQQQQQQQRVAASRPGPGSFEVDEEAAQRALERTLTQSGALLLNAGAIELTPGLVYRRVEQTTPALLNVTTPGSTTPVTLLANQRTRRNELSAHLGIRAGLPYNLQAELDLPYDYVRSSQVNELGGTSTDNAGQFGDVTLGLAKTLMRESGWKPDLIGRVSYNFGNASRRKDTLDMIGGHRQLQGELVALKRQDPLAFVGSVFYNKTYEEDGIKPGDAMGFSLSSVLAASPATSLSLGFSQIYRGKQELNGLKLPGSDQTYGVVSLGATSVLSRDVSLITQFGIGVGNDAPKYNFSISLPITFR